MFTLFPTSILAFQKEETQIRSLLKEQVILLCITLCPFLFYNHLEEERKAGCFAIIVLQMYCYCKYFVALPHDAVGWSAVCDFGISRSYSLTFFFYTIYTGMTSCVKVVFKWKMV